MDAEEETRIRKAMSHPSVDHSVPSEIDGYAEQQAPISVRQADDLLLELDALRAKLAGVCQIEHAFAWEDHGDLGQRLVCQYCGKPKPADPAGEGK